MFIVKVTDPYTKGVGWGGWGGGASQYFRLSVTVGNKTLLTGFYFPVFVHTTKCNIKV